MGFSPHYNPACCFRRIAEKKRITRCGAPQQHLLLRSGAAAAEMMTPMRKKPRAAAARRVGARARPASDEMRLAALLLAGEAKAAGADPQYCAELRAYETRRRQRGARACVCSMADVLSSADDSAAGTGGDAGAGGGASTGGPPVFVRGGPSQHRHT